MIAYTDGSAHPNPGPGGYGVVLLDDNGDLIHAFNRHKDKTTNNEMELAAIICAASFAKHFNCPLTIYSDSSYAIGCLSTWMHSWARNGWVKSDNKIPENLDIIKYFYENHRNDNINFVKIKGHKGDKWNEFADLLATEKITPLEVAQTWMNK